MPKACVVIPTRNEADSIVAVLADIRRSFANTKYSELVLIVVDDSTDKTRRLAREAGAVVVGGGGDGLGAAMYHGLKVSLRYQPDIIVAVDGDG